MLLRGVKLKVMMMKYSVIWKGTSNGGIIRDIIQSNNGIIGKIVKLGGKGRGVGGLEDGDMAANGVKSIL